jgi:hypothetical protein
MTEEINLHLNKFMEGGRFGNHCEGFGHMQGYGERHGGHGYGGHGH